jgi:hypothetical protein
MDKESCWQKVVEARKLIHGWTFEDKSKYMFDVVLEKNPSIVAEVGVWSGLSIASFCAASLITKTKVFAIDPWCANAMSENGYNSSLGYNQDELDKVAINFESNFKNIGLDENMSIIRKTSFDASFDFKNESIDIFHLDGAHTEWDSMRDLIAWTPKIKVGGLFIMDDANWETMKLAQELALKKYEHSTYLEGGKTRVFVRKQ